MKRRQQAASVLFYDESPEGIRAREALTQRGEVCLLYDVEKSGIRFAERDVKIPLLIAPEGEFSGWQEIQDFLAIHPAGRYFAIRAELGSLP